MKTVDFLVSKEAKVEKGKFSGHPFDPNTYMKTIDFLSQKRRLGAHLSLEHPGEGITPPPKALFPCIELMLQTLPPTSGAA